MWILKQSRSRALWEPEPGGPMSLSSEGLGGERNELAWAYLLTEVLANYTVN